MKHNEVRASTEAERDLKQYVAGKYPNLAPHEVAAYEKYKAMKGCVCKHDGMCCPLHDPNGARD